MAIESKTLFDAAMELQVSDAPTVRQAVPFFKGHRGFLAILCGWPARSD
jgi:hypothetical protein